MKKIIFSVVAIAVLSLGSVYAQNDNGLIGRARGESQECLKFFQGPDWILTASVGEIGSCFAGGFITQVTFAARPTPQPCIDFENCNPPALPIVVATVQFGCDGEVIYSSCY